ncbi:uncharacterized protein LOC134207473 [Armigeres subalbatus]|uniref:uncharacterized protein LOC134207473 n=1 Tax=Armigeres subalbatus TaxID=124917 RepID=UPI002ED07CDE
MLFVLGDHFAVETDCFAREDRLRIDAMDQDIKDFLWVALIRVEITKYNVDPIDAIEDGSDVRLNIYLSLIFTTKFVQPSEDVPSWMSNQTIQALIMAIFGGINRIDVVLGDLSPDQSYPSILDHLIRGDDSRAILHGKTIRFYHDVIPGRKDAGCNSAWPVLSASKINVADAYDDDWEQEFADMSRFIKWDRSYESFAKIFDQNQRYGYLVFSSWFNFQLSMACLLDPYATYLIFLSDGHRFDLVEVATLTQRVWFNQGISRIFFVIDERIYTFDPFRVVAPREYGVMIELRGMNDIPSVPKDDFKGYPLRVDRFRSTFSRKLLNNEGNVIDYVGPDPEACRVFAQALNMTTNITILADGDFGFKLTNGSFNGALGRLSRRESDIVIVGYFIKDYFSYNTEFTTGIYTDELCCLVQKASRVPDYLLPITIFPANLWGLLFLTGIVCSVTWIIIRAGIRFKAENYVNSKQRLQLRDLFNLSNSIRNAPLYRKMIQIVVDTYIILVSAPYRRFTRSGIERLILVGIMMVSLIFVSTFQSRLSSVFLHPMYYKDIDSLQMLDESGIIMPVKYKGFLDDVFPANYSSMMTSLRNKMVYDPEQDGFTLDLVVRSPEISFVTRKSLVPLDAAIYVARKQVIVVPECPRLYNLAFVVPRHSVLLERINAVILRMLNGGLINHWIDVMNFNATVQNLALYRSINEEKFKILTLKDLQFPFYVWAIGLILSSMVFMCEKTYYRLAVTNRIIYT